MRPFASLLLLVIGTSLSAQTGITVNLDLRDQRNDRLEVELIVTPLRNEPLIFALPRTVPGIYGAMDHGRLAGGIGAFDKDGNPIPIARLDVNRWTVPEPETLHRITYSVDDGWEEFDIRFAMGTYRSSEGTVKPEAAVINHNTVIGYFEGHEQLPYT
ncbi:MAG: hypothetical protein WAT74_17485, partial [Flavobacteriales bacterium]